VERIRHSVAPTIAGCEMNLLFIGKRDYTTKHQ
jgi:hypothetical protein